MCTRFSAFLLIFCSLSASLSSLFVFAGFEMNLGYIAKELCVNKNKPQLHCNGKCYLMRKLKQAEEKEQKQSLKVQLQYTFATRTFNFRQYAYRTINFHIPLSTGVPQSNLKAIFHPPKYGC